jgi:enoyl-CoA hydratase
MGKDFATLKLDRPDAHVLVVTLSRPEAANALNTQMGLDLLAFWDELAAEPGATRAVVLTGAGSRVFCAGADLKERNGMTDQAWQAQHLVFERMVRAFLACPVPVIGAVNGAAFGGGCELALACDFAYAAESARFALPEASLGIMPGAGGTQTLPRAVGARRAKEIMLAGLPFSARDALSWGVVNRVCAGDALMGETVEIARRIAANAPLAVRQIKHAVQGGQHLDLAQALAFEIEHYNRLVPTADRREGISAYNEKRKPKFEGR